MFLLRSVLILLALFLSLAWPGQVRAAEQQLVSMLRLIPRSPGGSAAQPLPLALYAESGFYFELGIRDALGNSPFEDYITRRLTLLNAIYSIRILDHGRVDLYTPATAGAFWTGVEMERGTYRVPGSLLPDHVYSWYVLAQVDEVGGSVFSVRSEPLYFHTAGYDVLLAEGNSRRDGSLAFVNGLGLLGQLQAAESVAVRHSLQGVSSYVNYPLATDSYICSAIDPPGSRPLPAPSQQSLLELPDLLELGAIMREAHELHAWIEGGRDPLGQLKSLSTHCRLFINSLQARGSGAAEDLASLLEVARRSGIEEALSDQEKLALLSELLLLGDQLVASGTVRLESDSVLAFAEYARSTDRRLRQLSDMEPALFSQLGAERGRFWQEFFRSQRAELALINEDIRSGMLTESGLEELLRKSRDRASMQLPAAFDGNEKVQYADELSAFAKLAPTGDAAAFRKLLEAQLSWVAASVWPGLE